MSEIEALLAVDAGHTPPATMAFMAFFARDAEASERLTYAILGAMTAFAALASGLLGGPDLVGALLILTAAMFTIVATPTIKNEHEEDTRPIKRHVMVVTTEAIIVRDAWGLRSWRFEDLAEIAASSYDHRPYMVLIKRDGSRHALDYLNFQRPEQLRQTIDRQLRLKTT
jgi:hypothetical protein